MDAQIPESCTAFNHNQRVASGPLVTVAKTVKEIMSQDSQASILIFDDTTSGLAEVDFRGSLEEVIERLEKPSAGGVSPRETDPPSQRRPGRPKLGVISREVTLLPRHWAWLNRQPGGASVALRKLVEEAKRVNSSKDKVRCSQEAAYRFMAAMAGNFPGFEEATRALFAGDFERFNQLVTSWPIDIRDHSQKLAAAAFPNRG